MKIERVTHVMDTIVLAEAYCLPQEAMNALDTAQLWAYIIAATALVIALIAGGITIAFSRSHGGGDQIVGILGKIIIGAGLVAAASGIAGVLIGGITQNCTPLG